jgi:hypothetical protein
MIDHCYAVSLKTTSEHSSEDIGSLMSHSCAFGLGLKPTFSFKGFRLDRVLMSPKLRSELRLRVKGSLWILKRVLSYLWVLGLHRVFNGWR